MRRLPLIAAWCALALLLLAASACKSPTEAPAGAATLATSHGTVTVYTNGLPFDAARAVAAIEDGYALARGEVGPRVDAVRLDGMVVTVERSVYDGAAVGWYHPESDTAEMQAGVEAVLAHELQHRFANALGFGPPCTTCVDHSSGSLGCPVGYTLGCRPV